METLIAKAGEEAVSEVLPEALAELTGRSNRKWALILVAFVVGGVAVVVGAKFLRRPSVETLDAPEVDTMTTTQDVEVPA
jgi:hypothetical protein